MAATSCTAASMSHKQIDAMLAKKQQDREDANRAAAAADRTAAAAALLALTQTEAEQRQNR